MESKRLFAILSDRVYSKYPMLRMHFLRSSPKKKGGISEDYEIDVHWNVCGHPHSFTILLSDAGITDMDKVCEYEGKIIEAIELTLKELK